MRKPTVVKTYACVFVSLSVKAVHLELSSDLTTEAFVACLRKSISRRGKPSVIWSDHGSNFVGTNREIEIAEFLQTQRTQGVILDFCSMQKHRMEIYTRTRPSFWGICEAAVESMKTHLKRTLGNMKLTFEELTVLCQVEACLTSRPLQTYYKDYTAFAN